MAKGDKKTLKSPKGCVLLWSSADERIATVDAKGTIRAKRLGSTEIFCQIVRTDPAQCPEGHPGDRASLRLNVRAKNEIVRTVSLEESRKTLSVGEQFCLRVELKPRNAPDREIRFESKNEKVARVDRDGTITGVSAGQTWVTIRSSSGAKARLLVRVASGALRLTVKPQKKTLRVGETMMLRAKTTPLFEPITYKSLKEHVAVVDSDGLVRALSRGKTKIVLTTPGGLRANCLLTVR